MLSLPLNVYTLKILITTKATEIIALKTKHKDKKTNYIHLLNPVFYS